MFNNYKKKLIHYYRNKLKRKSFIIKFKTQIQLKHSKKIIFIEEEKFIFFFRVKLKKNSFFFLE